MSLSAARATPPPHVHSESYAAIPFAVVVSATIAVCGLVSLLPDGLPWWPLKLATATYTVLLVPGAVILRALGWPPSPAAALAASTAWSMAALAPGLVLVVALDERIDVAILWLLVVTAAGLFVGRGKPIVVGTRISRSLVVFLGLAAAVTVVVALARHSNAGDAMEHIARIRKLTELNPLHSLAEINLLPPDTGLHPGYAFPLWHAAIALIVRIAGADEALAYRSISPLLIPLVAAALYRAGASMFGCRVAGVAAWVASLALFAFPYMGVGYFDKLAYPGNVSIFILWPLVVDRAFVYLREGGREPPWTIAATAFVVAAIHASYNPMMMLLVGAFGVARLLVVREPVELRRFAVLLAAVSAPFLLFLVWLRPIAASGGVTAADVDHFATQLDRSADMVRVKPGYVARGGAAYVAALLLAPLAAAATRTRAAAFIASGTAIVVLTLVVPWAFTPFSDVMSVSQGRRFLFFLPWVFALVGAALVLARFRMFAVAGALVAGALLQLAYPGDFAYQLVDPGPGWVAWFGALAVVFVFAAGAAGKIHLRYEQRWALPIVAAFTLPIAFGGLPDVGFATPDESGFKPELVQAVTQHVEREDVVMAPLKLAYRLTAHAPVYVVAVTKGHSADTFVNKHGQRRIDVATFFRPGTSVQRAGSILQRWNVRWLLVDKAQPYPEQVVGRAPPVYDDGTYALYPVEGTRP